MSILDKGLIFSLPFLIIIYLLSLSLRLEREELDKIKEEAVSMKLAENYITERKTVEWRWIKSIEKE